MKYREIYCSSLVYVCMHVCTYILAGVPALSHRLGRISCDRTFGALMGGCAPYDHAFGTLIVHSLSIKKSLAKKTVFP